MRESVTGPSRRQFLGGAAAGLGSYALVPRCFAEGNRPPESTLSVVVVSDTHLGYRDQESAARQWETTAEEISRSTADLVLHLGDVVDGGREAQYSVYLKTRETIGKPVHEIPGNHDPQPLFEKYLRKPVDTVVEHGWLRFLLLNNSHTDSHDGFLSEAQLTWLETRCREAKQDDKYVALCMHVPAHSNKHPDRGWYVKPEHGQRELYEIVTRYQDRVVCLMHGHFHNGIRGWDDHAPVHEIIFPSALYNRDRRLEEQMAPGYNLPEFRPGYTQLTIEKGTMQLIYRPVGVAETAEKTLPISVQKHS